MTDRVYCYPPDFSILRNKFAIKDAATLERVEREAVTMRLMEGAPIGRFDLSHLRAINKHLFQDVYDWAGEIRTVEIAKGGQQFQPRGYLETGMADVHRRLREQNLCATALPKPSLRPRGISWGTSTTCTPSAKATDAPSLSIFASLAAMPDTPSTSAGSKETPG